MEGQGLTPATLGNPAAAMVVMLVLRVLSALVFAVVFRWLLWTGVAAGVTLAALLWLGFILLSLGMHYTFANRPFSVLAIDAGYELPAQLATGAIIGRMQR